MPNMSEEQILNITSGIASLQKQMLEMDDRRKSQKQQLIIQWIGALTGVVIVCHTMLGAFKDGLDKTVKMSSDTMMIHIDNLSKKLESFESKFIVDERQSVDIAKNAQAIEANTESIKQINSSLRQMANR